jgi:adenine-specific DNA-methyltransferase
VNYEDLSREQLLNLLVKRETERRLGLVWERDEIAHDSALNSDFAAMNLDQPGSVGDSPWTNLLVTGENFDALRWLRMTHPGRARLIYIDPSLQHRQSGLGLQ